MKILKNDYRDFSKYADMDIGIFYVSKKNTLATFSFGKHNSSFSNVEDAHTALLNYISKRKDVDLLNVTVLNNHW